MDNSFRLIEEDIRQLSRMSSALFEAWQDKLSDYFQNGCLEPMNRMWKEYQSAAEQLLRQLEKNEKEVEQYRERCKKR